jgi:tetratricopeptide (TPR) repeat protein
MRRMTDFDLADSADGSRAVASQKRRRLNVRLMAGSLIAVAVLIGGAFTWSELQVRRLSAGLVLQTAELAGRHRFLDAANSLEELLKLRPGWKHVPAVKCILAEMYDRGAIDADGKRHAVELYREALKKCTKKNHVIYLGRLSDLLSEVGEFEAAKQPARELLDLDKDDQKAWRVLALANYELFRAGMLTLADKDLQSAAEVDIQAQAGLPVTVGITGRYFGDRETGRGVSGRARVVARRATGRGGRKSPRRQGALGRGASGAGRR